MPVSEHRHHLRRRAARHPAPGPRRDPRRRDPRRGDRPHRHAGGADRPLRAVVAARGRLGRRGAPLHRHGHRAVPGRLGDQRRGRPATAAPHLHRLSQRRTTPHPGRGPHRRAQHAGRPARALAQGRRLQPVQRHRLPRPRRRVRAAAGHRHDPRPDRGQGHAPRDPRAAAVAEGMRTMQEQAFELVVDGLHHRRGRAAQRVRAGRGHRRTTRRSCRGKRELRGPLLGAPARGPPSTDRRHGPTGDGVASGGRHDQPARSTADAEASATATRQEPQAEPKTAKAKPASTATRPRRSTASSVKGQIEAAVGQPRPQRAGRAGHAGHQDRGAQGPQRRDHQGEGAARRDHALLAADGDVPARRCAR